MGTSVNNKCKTFTSLKQGRELAKILSNETADMYYAYDIPYAIPYKNGIGLEEPCWSLAALLGVLPKIHGLKPIIDLEETSIQYSGIDLYVIGENLVDACYNMIIELHKQELL